MRCPVCDGSNLSLVISCLATRLWCAICNQTYSLEQLAPRLDERAFARVAELLGDRLSDRV